MVENIECRNPRGTDCNGCPVVGTAQRALEKEPTRPVVEVLGNVAKLYCPEGKGPTWTELRLSESRRI